MLWHGNCCCSRIQHLTIGESMSKPVLMIIMLVSLLVLVSSGTVLLYLLQPSVSPTQSTFNTPPTNQPGDTDLPPQPQQSGNTLPDTWPDSPSVVADAKLTALNKEKTLYLETLPSGKKRLHFKSEVCLREGVYLEVLLCKTNTKEHEAILRTSLDAKLLHAGLIATGAKPGNTVHFVNPKTEEPEYKPASGTKIRVLVQYKLNNQLHTHPAQEWITDRTTKRIMAHEWVFAGSRFAKFPDRPDDPEYYCANNGEVIAVSNFVDSMLDLPVEVSSAAEELVFEAVYKKVPEAGSPVWVILEPQ